MLDNLLKVSSLSGAFLIFCGVLKLIIFYSAFDIEIVDFLSISEIITSFLDDINILIAFMTTAMILSFISLLIGSKRQGVGFHSYIDNNYMDNFDKAIKSSFFVTSVPITILTLLITTNILSLSYLVIYILFLCVFTLLGTLMIVVLKKSSEEEDIKINEEIETLGEEDSPDSNSLSTFFGVFVAIIPIILTVVLFARYDVDSVYSKPHNVKITVEGNGVISCGKAERFLYIGKTERFVFVKDKSTNAVDVINIDDVKKYAFSKKNN